MHEDLDDLDAIEDLDPDWDDVPAALRERRGQVLTIVTPDGCAHSGVLAIDPSLFAAARRAREDAA
jgi:hypothetical protein